MSNVITTARLRAALSILVLAFFATLSACASETSRFDGTVVDAVPNIYMIELRPEDWTLFEQETRSATKAEVSFQEETVGTITIREPITVGAFVLSWNASEAPSFAIGSAVSIELLE